jgi:hypothetical protein
MLGVLDGDSLEKLGLLLGLPLGETLGLSLGSIDGDALGLKLGV